MKIYTSNRTIYEMDEIWAWVIDTFGPPGNHNGNRRRWAYGKDSGGSYRSGILNGTWEIEWFDFANEKDATMFALRWA